MLRGQDAKCITKLLSFFFKMLIQRCEYIYIYIYMGTYIHATCYDDVRQNIVCCLLPPSHKIVYYLHDILLSMVARGWFCSVVTRPAIKIIKCYGLDTVLTKIVMIVMRRQQNV